MEKKYFNNNGHPTAIYIPEGVCYSIKGLEAVTMGCCASDGKLEIITHKERPAILYNEKNPHEEFPEAIKSEGETVITIGSEFCRLPGRVTPKGYRTHDLDEEWDSDTDYGKVNPSVDLNKVSLTSLYNVFREVKKVLEKTNQN